MDGNFHTMVVDWDRMYFPLSPRIVHSIVAAVARIVVQHCSRYLHYNSIPQQHTKDGLESVQNCYSCYIILHFGIHLKLNPAVDERGLVLTSSAETVDWVGMYRCWTLVLHATM